MLESGTTTGKESSTKPLGRTEPVIIAKQLVTPPSDSNPETDSFSAEQNEGQHHPKTLLTPIPLATTTAIDQTATVTAPDSRKPPLKVVTSGSVRRFSKGSMLDNREKRLSMGSLMAPSRRRTQSDSNSKTINSAPSFSPLSAGAQMKASSDDDNKGDRAATLILVAATDENTAECPTSAKSVESNWFKSQTVRSSEEDTPTIDTKVPGRESGSSTASSGTSKEDGRGSEGLLTHYEKLMLRAQKQRDTAMSEANLAQQRYDEVQRTSAAELLRIESELKTLSRRLQNEYELRTVAERKCTLMECELAELSSNIQLEAQNLVAQERREHKKEMERMTRKHTEVVHLMEMERAQVASLKQSVGNMSEELDRERGETDRLRNGMVAFERQVSTLMSPVHQTGSGSSSRRISSATSMQSLTAVAEESTVATRSVPPSLECIPDSAAVFSAAGRMAARRPPPLPIISSERSMSLLSLNGSTTNGSVTPSAAATTLSTDSPHIFGKIYFGDDAARPDTRLAEFLGFVNMPTEKEAQSSLFMQRSIREDVAPTLLADSAGGTNNGLPSITGWSRNRRLLHGVQENTLVLETYKPRAPTSRVLSLACYLCSHSVNRFAGAGPTGRILSTSSTGSSISHLSSSPGSSNEMYRMRFNDNDDENKPLCTHCHGRMVAVCSFFAYLKIVRKGLIKRPIADIWLEVNKARLQMWMARSGASLNSSLSLKMS